MARYDLGRDELADLLAGEPAYRVDQLWSGLYHQLVDPAGITTLPARLRQRLADEPVLARSLTPVAERRADSGSTVKWLWSLSDGARIETVLMDYGTRSTVCVSSQAGCAMGCGFCATGQAGFTRHLSVGEIVEQVVAAGAARRRAEDGRPLRPGNVVFMGMGEPLANYTRVWGAVERLHDDLGISARHITISTVGVVPGILRLAQESLPVNLAVSLHAANDTRRDELVPLNRRYPLEKLMEACRRYLDSTGRRISFEWALIAGVNDTSVDAGELAQLALPLGAHVNLIPLNPTPGYPTVGSTPAVVSAFRDRLVTMGVNATVRRNRGTRIDAACGQLAAREMSAPIELGAH